MARKRTARHPQPSEAKSGGQEKPEQESQPAEPAKRGRRAANGGISKVDAVRTVLAEGFESPADGVAEIKGRFGLDLNAQHFSSIKSQLKSRAGEPGRKAAAPAPTASPSLPTARNGGIDLLETLETIKALVGEHGADTVRRMVDLVG